MRIADCGLRIDHLVSLVGEVRMIQLEESRVSSLKKHRPQNPQSRKSAIRNPQSAIEESAIRNPQIRNRDVAAIIAAGGTGTRMSAGVPKQFLELAGKPILLRTIEGILSLQDLIEIVVALPSEYVASAQELIDRKRWRVPVRCVGGGSTRQRSVIRGLAQVDPRAGLILVHDAVRPLCDPEIMRRVVDAARLGRRSGSGFAGNRNHSTSFGSAANPGDAAARAALCDSDTAVFPCRNSAVVARTRFQGGLRGHRRVLGCALGRSSCRGGSRMPRTTSRSLERWILTSPSSFFPADELRARGP